MIDRVVINSTSAVVVIIQVVFAPSRVAAPCANARLAASSESTETSTAVSVLFVYGRRPGKESIDYPTARFKCN